MMVIVWKIREKVKGFAGENLSNSDLAGHWTGGVNKHAMSVKS